MFDSAKNKLKSLPSEHRRWTTFGTLFVVLFTLPVMVYGLLTGQFEIRKRAATGEITPTPTPTNGPDFLACNSDTDCACGTNEVTNQCAVGNKGYIDTSRQCPDFCGGFDNKSTTRCVSSLCQQVRISFTPTPTQSDSQKAQLSFKIKFQGISMQRPNKLVTVILKQNKQEKGEFPGVEVVSTADGVYTGDIMNIPLGTYDVLIKGQVSLQRKFQGIVLQAGKNIQNFSQTELLTGDINNDNRINAQDLALLTKDYQPHTPPNSPADLDSDGFVNAQDIRFVIENYRKEGDE